MPERDPTGPNPHARCFTRYKEERSRSARILRYNRATVVTVLERDCGMESSGEIELGWVTRGLSVCTRVVVRTELSRPFRAISRPGYRRQIALIVISRDIGPRHVEITSAKDSATRRMLIGQKSADPSTSPSPFLSLSAPVLVPFRRSASVRRGSRGSPSVEGTRRDRDRLSVLVSVTVGKVRVYKPG